MGKNKSFALEIYKAAAGTDVSPLFITAQACLETGWGKSAVGKYNLWGVKANASWKGNRVLVRTTEIIKSGHALVLQKGEEVISKTILKSGNVKYIAKLWFRDYDSLHDAVLDHNKVLMDFTSAWPYRNDPYKFVDTLQTGPKKYATDPSYASTMKGVYRTLEKMGIK